MKTVRNNLLMVVLFGVVCCTIYGMNEVKEDNFKDVQWVGSVLMGSSTINPGEEIIFSLTQLPPEIASKVASYLFVYNSATSLIEAGKVINMLAQVNKELNQLINDPDFSRELIRYLANKYNASDQEVIKALQTEEAGRDLRYQRRQQRLYTLCHLMASYHVMSPQEIYELHQLCKAEGINLNFMYSNMQFGNNFTLLMMACYMKSKALVDLLILYGADINFANNDGLTALMYAVSRGNVDAVKIVLSCPNININQQDINGNTALMLAVKGEFSESKIIIPMLLDAGANPEIADFKGVTPLAHAKEENIFDQNKKVIAILKQALQKKHGK